MKSLQEKPLLVFFVVVLCGVHGLAFAQNKKRKGPSPSLPMLFPHLNQPHPFEEREPIPIHQEPVRYSPCLNARMFILLDWSGSVRGCEPNIVNALASFIDQLSYSWERELYFEIIRFGDKHEVVAELTNRRLDLDVALEELSQSGANSKTTKMSTAMLRVRLKLEELEDQGEFQDVVIVVSDGHIAEEDRLLTKAMAEELAKRGVHIFGLNTGHVGSDDALMCDISNAGYFQSDLFSLKRDLERIDPCM